MARPAREMPIPTPILAPLLRLLELFVGAVVLEAEAEAEAGMPEAPDEVRDGTAVICGEVVEIEVALVVTAIVYPAAE